MNAKAAEEAWNGYKFASGIRRMAGKNKTPDFSGVL